MLANRVSSSTSCSIWRPQTPPHGSSRDLLPHRFKNCNTSGRRRTACPKSFVLISHKSRGSRDPRDELVLRFSIEIAAIVALVQLTRRLAVGAIDHGALYGRPLEDRVSP